MTSIPSSRASDGDRRRAELLPAPLARVWARDHELRAVIGVGEAPQHHGREFRRPEVDVAQAGYAAAERGSSASRRARMACLR